MIALNKINALAINLNSGIFVKTLPPKAIKNSDGNVLMPKNNIPIAAKSGFVIAAATKKAAYKRPQGMKPKTTPRI